MPAVRQGSSQKWVKRASASTDEFRQGVQTPRKDWQAATVAASGSWAKGVQSAISRGAQSAGVKAAGSAKWQAKTLSKGGDRFASGVADGESDYAKGVAPYLQVIASTQLPPRGPKGDPANLQRVALMANALRAKKVSMSGGSN